MDLSKLSSGKNPPEEINVVVEIPQGSSVKYELDKETGLVFVDRFSFTSMFFPFNYGFIPKTKADDGDPVDVLVIASYPVFPGAVVAAVPVGMLEMEDEAGVDTKIIAVPPAKTDPFHSNIKNMDDISEATRNLIKHFFEHYKELEPKKWVKVKNFLPKEKALDAIKKSLL
ncbi:inorganic diphosphatase [Candidatus Roizmanbacteria bacterium]|nr:inorganic diphosphatase [Candidatus Roizmanbacteria bacterium]